MSPDNQSGALGIRGCVLRRAALAVLLGCILTAIASMSYAQTYTVIYNFTGGLDGSNPSATLTLDRNGFLYGTAFSGGQFNNGTTFRMVHQGSDWLFNAFWLFPGVTYGSGPYAPLVFGPDGGLYGTTLYAGNGGSGIVFKLQPTPTRCRIADCWESVIGIFDTNLGLANPSGPLVFDSSGNIYGTVQEGDTGTNCGGVGCGSVYELAVNGDGLPSILYAFRGGRGQGLPESGVIFDSSGNLYGTTLGCFGTGGGTIFKLSPNGNQWSYSTLFESPGGIGGCLLAGLLMTSNGNLYFATADDGGAAFQGTLSGGSYTFSLMTKIGSGDGPFCGPQSSLIMDNAGNLYGTTNCDGANGLGSVFKISPAGGGWTLTDLHDFAGGDGQFPIGGLVLDTNGNLYGTTSQGGTGTACAGGCGVVFEITP